jgi:hypothetical protein
VQKVWSLPGPQNMSVSMDAVNFSAVAACAGIDSEGIVRAYILEDLSIDRYKFIRYLEELRRNIDYSESIFCVVD